MAEKESRFYKNIARQKMAYVGHVLRGSSGLNALLIMEGKISVVKARGRPRRAWTDDLKDWTELRNYSELKRTAEDRTIWNALARQPSFYLRRRHKTKKKKKIIFNLYFGHLAFGVIQEIVIREKYKKMILKQSCMQKNEEK